MCEGASTYSFKAQQHQSQDVYTTGKIGEWGVWRYLKSLPDITIAHTPFRESYQHFDPRDDFIIEFLNGERIQIEVKTKARNVAPQPHYECCTDCIRASMLYIFVSYDRQSNTVTLLGQAWWENFRAGAVVVERGETNINFEHRVCEFNIPISYLSPLIKR